MGSSTKLALFAFLRSLRSISLGRNLRAFILRCLLLWPRILRNLRRVWSSYFQTSSSGEKKTKGDTGGPSSTETLRKREDCVVVCASRDLGGGGEPSRHSISGSNDAEQSIPLDVVSSRTPSVHSLSSFYAPSLQGSPRLSPRHLSASGSPHSSASSLRLRDAMELFIHQSNTPVTPASWTNSHAAGRQFTVASSRGQSRSSSPFLRHFSRPGTPARHDIETRLAPIQQSQGSSEGSNSEVSIQVRPASPEDAQSMNSSHHPRLPSIDDQTQTFPTRRQIQSTESVNSSAVSSYSGRHSFWMSGANLGASQGRGSNQDSMTSPSTQVSSIPFPEPSVPPISTQTNALDSPSRLGTPSVGLMTSEQVSRYKKKGDVPREPSQYVLLPKEVDLPSYEFDKPGDWIPVTHPGGPLYFYHEANRTFTDVYMYDRTLREEVDMFVEVLWKKSLELENSNVPYKFPMPTNYDLVIDIVETKVETERETIIRYYYVDHDSRTLFWLDNYDMNGALSDILGVKQPGHIKRRLESLYWTHWSLYPTGYRGRNFPDDAHEELLGILLSSSIDSLTSKLSTAPYSVADMQTMSDIINKTKDLGTQNPHTICSVARLLSICVQWRVVHFHGQKTSRQNRYKSIFENSGRKRTYPFRLLSVILFFTPDVHLRELKKVWADELIIEEVWRNFMQKLVSEWMEFVLYSTVMLAVNVGFLAIQGVSVAAPKAPSPAQIASSMSLVFSLGSIIAGLLLIRRNRTMAMQDPATACKYLDSMAKPFFYLEPLAIVFSLNYALLMWSVCVFFAALLLFCCQNEKKSIWISVGAASGIVAILIIWCIVNCWDSSIRDSERDELRDIISEDEKNTT